MRSLERAIISPLTTLYSSTQSIDIRVALLKIFLHVLERHGEKLHYSWPYILDVLRSVAHAAEKDLISLGFQCLRIIMNDGLSSIPTNCLHVCIDVTGSYCAQKTELNISLTAVGLLWTSIDFLVKGAKGLQDAHEEHKESDKINNGIMEEYNLTSSNNYREQALQLNVIDRDKLLFSVFSLLQSLVADERPEVRNSAVRTLFQILGSHGQKLSNRMWENCLCNYVFPTLDCASHMAATSSKAEWQGKELGTRGGKAVHMLIHHSRNTAQKQWDETLVLVLGGIARVLRTFFPLLRNLSNFQSGWDSLLCLVENSILHGSKEVALAAINCLHSTIVSQSPKGNLPLPYLISVLDIYELVLPKLPNYSNSATSKVIQEIFLSLGDLYVQAQEMFDSFMYLKLLKVLDVGIKQTKIANRNFEADYGHLPPLQRTILEILPIVCPANHIATMWPPFLGKLMEYLPGCDSSIGEIDDGDEGNTSDSVDVPWSI